MIAHRVITKMIAVFEEEIARDEHKTSGRFAAEIARELVHSEANTGNMLSQAYNELDGRQNRAQMRRCIGIVVRLYQSRNSGSGRPSTPALKEARAEAMELQARNLNQSSDERAFVLRNYSRVGDDFGLADLFRELYPHSSGRQSEIDSFRHRFYAILKADGISKPQLKRGRTKRNQRDNPS